MKKLIKTNNQITFDSKTIQLIKDTVAVGASDTELQMFLYQAQKSGLDPIARQIYFLKRKVWNKTKNGYDEKVNIQASIDGFRVIAQRDKYYAGQDEPVFTETEGRVDIAKVTVYKFSPKGARYPAAVGVAYWAEYCPKEGQDFMWQKMPHTMLAKCAEALALRKAFPQELSGIYSQEEMDQAGVEVKVIEPTPAEEMIKEDSWLEEKQPPDKPNDLLRCQQCDRPIETRVHDYSMSKFSKPLCRDCQQLVKEG